MEKRAVFSLCAMLLLCASGFAATQTVTGTIALTSTDWSNPLAITKFNSSLGTLTQIEIQLNGSMNSILTIQNMSANKSSNGNGNVQVDITAVDPGALINQSFSLATTVFPYSLNHGQTTNSGTLTNSNSSDHTYVAPAILAEFTGSGTINLAITAGSTATLVNHSGATMIGDDTNSGLDAKVIYTYNPTPEPATIGLLTMGALTILRKKMK